MNVPLTVLDLFQTLITLTPLQCSCLVDIHWYAYVTVYSLMCVYILTHSFSQALDCKLGCMLHFSGTVDNCAETCVSHYWHLLDP